MITVDEVFPVDVRASVGPAGTIKRLFQNREFFQKRGYEMTIFANHFTHSHGIKSYYELREMTALPQQVNYTAVTGSGGFKKKVISFIKQWAQDTKLVAYFMVRYKENRTEEILLDTYIEKGRRPDIVVFHDFYGCFYYLTHRQSDDNAKVALFLHSDGKDIDQMYAKYPKLVGSKIYHRLYLDFIYNIEHVSGLVFISKIAYNEFLKRHPHYEKSKMFTAVNGIDDMPLIKLQPSCSAKYRLCTSGTVCERKGQYIIVEAMKRMNKDILKDTHLTIMGVGPDYKKLVDEVNSSELSKNVSFLGNVPNLKMHEKLSAENIYCLMSNNEGLPIAILEAMRAGLPIISTPIAGIPETVDERNGFLIEPDVNQLTNVLNHLPDYDWEALGKSSRQRFVEEFTFQRMLNDYANMFDSLVFNKS